MLTNFPEREAEHYVGARYGELKVAPSGASVLAGLRDGGIVKSPPCLFEKLLYHFDFLSVISSYTSFRCLIPRTTTVCFSILYTTR